MKKEFVISILSVSFILSVLTVPVFAEKAPAKDKKTQSVERYKNFLGKDKKVAGAAYSAQQTAGVAGGAQAGLNSKNQDKKVDAVKKDLYENEKPVSVLDKIFKHKKVKSGK